MIQKLIDKASEHLPVQVSDASYADPVLNLYGDDWNLTVLTAWRVVGPQGLEFSAYSPDASHRVQCLVGSTISRIGAQSAYGPVDPAFVLSSAQVLEVFSLEATEPWVFRIAGQVWVASPTALSAFD